MEWYYVWWPWLTSKRVAQVCQHQLSFLFPYEHSLLDPTVEDMPRHVQRILADFMPACQPSALYQRENWLRGFEFQGPKIAILDYFVWSLTIPCTAVQAAITAMLRYIAWVKLMIIISIILCHCQYIIVKHHKASNTLYRPSPVISDEVKTTLTHNIVKL